VQDITVTDVDPRPARDHAGQPDGAAVTLQDVPAPGMRSLYSRPFDASAPNFGQIPPPEVAPYIGHCDIVIPLGGDLNGNGTNDVLKFTLATHSVGDENREFLILPDGTVLDEFDSAAFLEGAVVDETSRRIVGEHRKTGLTGCVRFTTLPRHFSALAVCLDLTKRHFL